MFVRLKKMGSVLILSQAIVLTIVSLCGFHLHHSDVPAPIVLEMDRDCDSKYPKSDDGPAEPAVPLSHLVELLGFTVLPEPYRDIEQCVQTFFLHSDVFWVQLSFCQMNFHPSIILVSFIYSRLEIEHSVWQIKLLLPIDRPRAPPHIIS